MQWRDVTRRPDEKVLRQFGGLCLAIGGAIVAWQTWQATVDWRSYVFGGLAVAGAIGFMWPPAIRWLYSGWMVAVFPIGWTISHLVIGGMFFLVFTPVSLFFRLTRRDALRLRRPATDSLWIPKHTSARADAYLRQF